MTICHTIRLETHKFEFLNTNANTQMQIAQGNCQRWFTFDKNELSKATNSEQRLNILDGEGARTGVQVAKGGSRFRFKYLHLDLIFILNYFHLHESHKSICTFLGNMEIGFTKNMMMKKDKLRLAMEALSSSEI